MDSNSAFRGLNLNPNNTKDLITKKRMSYVLSEWAEAKITF
jgi:hypothetical protein